MGFGPPVTPPVIKQLLIANAIVFFAQYAFRLPVFELLMASPADFWQRGYLWQPFTYMWMHAGLGHILANMFVLWMFGSPVALVWGPQRFLRYYLLCGVGAGLIIVSYPWIPVLLGGATAATLHSPDARGLGRDLRGAARVLAHLARSHHHADLPAGRVPRDLADPPALLHGDLFRAVQREPHRPPGRGARRMAAVAQPGRHARAALAGPGEVALQTLADAEAAAFRADGPATQFRRLPVLH